MRTKPANQGNIYFLDFTFNPNLRTLQHGEQVLQLRKKQSDVLALLCDKYPNTVSHDEFLTEVWDCGYVTSQSIAQVIRSLRVSLGDEKKSIIFTVPKLGYQLTARPTREETGTEKCCHQALPTENVEPVSFSFASQQIIDVNSAPFRAMSQPHSAPEKTPPEERKFTSRRWMFSALVVLFFSLICAGLSAQNYSVFSDHKENTLQKLKKDKIPEVNIQSCTVSGSQQTKDDMQ